MEARTQAKNNNKIEKDDEKEAEDEKWMKRKDKHITIGFEMTVQRRRLRNIWKGKNLSKKIF